MGSVIVGKKKAVALGKELEHPVYQISARRFIVTDMAAWETGLESVGIGYDLRYGERVYNPDK